MSAYRLVRIIENHSERLASNLLFKVRNSTRTREYARVPEEELRARVYEIYRHLGEWLEGKTELEIERRYADIGAVRAEQGVPVTELLWAIVFTKETLWEFLVEQAVPERPFEVFGQMELLRLMDQFFDRALCYAAEGHERVRLEMRPMYVN